MITKYNLNNKLKIKYNNEIKNIRIDEISILRDCTIIYGVTFEDCTKGFIKEQDLIEA